MNILIIGCGVVGSNMLKEFHDADVHDPVRGYFRKKDKQYDVAFVCVPTEMKEDGSCDTSIVELVIKEHKDHVTVFAIRSTIPPGTTELLQHSCGLSLVFSPEYYGGTVHANYRTYDFILLGGRRSHTAVVAEAYKMIKHPEFKIYQTDNYTAELCKYMENCWIATKVTFCNEFYRLARAVGVDYNELRELWLADPRINRSHTFVYPDTPYYDSHCLNKDIPALIAYAKKIKHPARLMEAISHINELHKHDQG
jgi:UDPglucose 6-dehydrogenase